MQAEGQNFIEIYFLFCIDQNILYYLIFSITLLQDIPVMYVKFFFAMNHLYKGITCHVIQVNAIITIIMMVLNLTTKHSDRPKCIRVFCF